MNPMPACCSVLCAMLPLFRLKFELTAAIRGRGSNQDEVQRYPLVLFPMVGGWAAPRTDHYLAS